MKCKS